MLDRNILLEVVRRALMEDIGPGDITSEILIPLEVNAEAVITAQDHGVVAGMDVARMTFLEVDPTLTFTQLVQDGQPVDAGQSLARVAGAARAILAAERTALNFLARLSGIATYTRMCADAIFGFDAVIVDTRKTAPGLRMLEKYATRVGGARNHRMGLYDGVLIKDNHVKAAGGVRAAVMMAQKLAPHTLRIEVEVETLEEVAEALAAQADIIMLDNMDLPTMRDAVMMIDHAALVEASGGIRLDFVREVASTGVDLISMGSLTQAFNNLDIHLEVEVAIGHPQGWEGHEGEMRGDERKEERVEYENILMYDALTGEGAGGNGYVKRREDEAAPLDVAVLEEEL